MVTNIDFTLGFSKLESYNDILFSANIAQGFLFHVSHKWVKVAVYMTLYLLDDTDIDYA